MKKLLTIYICNHNYGRYIEDSINSVISQKEFSEIELIIIDDGSTDNSLETINKYKKFFDKVILNEKAIGLIKSSNIAIKASKGVYVLRLDSDDTLEPNSIKEYLSIIKDNKFECVFSDYNLIDDNNNITSVFKRSVKSDLFENDRTFHGACTAIKRSFFDEINGYDEEFYRQDGYYVWLKSKIKNKKIKHLPITLFNYRKHNFSLSSDLRKLFNVRYKIKRKLLNHLLNDTLTILIPLQEDKYINERLSITNDLIKYLNVELDFVNIFILMNPELINRIKSNENVNFFNREFGSKTYIKDIRNCVKTFNLKDFIVFEPEYPLLNLNSIIELFLTSKFHSHSICKTVYVDSNDYMYHNGTGINYLNRNSYLRSERDDLFRISGGLKYFKNIFFFNELESRKTINSGHVEIDALSTIRIELFNKINQYEK